MDLPHFQNKRLIYRCISKPVWTRSRKSKRDNRENSESREREREREREEERERERKSHVRGYARARACPDMYTHREARTAARILALAAFTLRFALSPPQPLRRHPSLCAHHTTPPVLLPPSLQYGGGGGGGSSLAPSFSSVRRRSPTPERSQLPPLVSASSRLALSTRRPEGSGQFMPNYTLITVMARLRYRWCTES